MLHVSLTLHSEATASCIALLVFALDNCNIIINRLAVVLLALFCQTDPAQVDGMNMHCECYAILILWSYSTKFNRLIGMCVVKSDIH